MVQAKRVNRSKIGLTPCPKCFCGTHSIRMGRANYTCGKCGADKSLSDLLFWDATHDEPKSSVD